MYVKMLYTVKIMRYLVRRMDKTQPRPAMTGGEELRAEYKFDTLDMMEEAYEAVVRGALIRALEVSSYVSPGGSVVLAASILGVNRSKLARLMTKLDVSRRNGRVL